MLKRKPANKKNQMFLFYVGKSKPKQNNIDLESATEILIKEDNKMVVKRLSGRIYRMLDSKSYTKFDDTPENKEIFVYEHIKTDKVDNHIITGYESDGLYANDPTSIQFLV